jgi:hypothetical protein
MVEGGVYVTQVTRRCHVDIQVIGMSKGAYIHSKFSSPPSLNAVKDNTNPTKEAAQGH